jgi:cytochrome c-type biogenesis protein CcmH
MTSRVRLAAAVLFLVALALPALAAVRPSEVLPNPALEARARSLSENLRCMVCQNQSIDDSDSELAHDLRVLVRERLMAGDSDSQVIDYVVSRYGEFVLLKPRFSLRNAALWSTPAVILLLGGLYLAAARGRRQATAQLSAEEKAALDRILARRADPTA